MPKAPAKPSRLVILTLTYAAAILAARFVSPPPWVLFAASVVAFLAIWPLSKRGMAGWAVLAAFFALGMLAAPVSLRPGRDDVSRFLDKPATVTGSVVSLPALGRSSGRLVLAAESAWVEGRERPVSGRVQVFLPPESMPEFGDRIRVTGILRSPRPPTNPGQFSYRDYLARQRIFAILYAEQPEDVERLRPARRYALQRWASSLRGAMLGVIERSMPPERAAVVGSMVFGMQAARIPEETEEDFRRSGTIHLLVVSGSQVMALVFLLLWLARRFFVRPTIAALVILPVVCFYALMTGAGSSVLRAAVAGILAAWGMSLSRETDRWTLVSAAALFILALNPMALYEISFQLTFAAVIGILAFSGPIYRRILPQDPSGKHRVARALGYVAMLFSVSLAAQLTTAPLIAGYFQELSPIGVIANLAAVPIAGLLVPLGIATSALGAVWLPLGHALGSVDGWVVEALARWVRALAYLPGAHWILPPVPTGAIVGWYALLALAGMSPSWMTRERWALVGAAAVLVPFAAWGFRPATPSPLRIYFLDVGRGSATLVITPSGKSVLVNAGGRRPSASGGWKDPYDAGERVVLPALRALGVRRLDVVAVTDGSGNHAGGLPAVVGQVPVKLALLPPAPGLSRVRKALDAGLVATRLAAAGAAVDLGNGVRIEVVGLHGSAAYRLCYRNLRVLLAGDFDARSARGYVGTDCAADVLQAGWKGSSVGEEIALASAIRPRVAIFGEEKKPAFLAALKVGSAMPYFTRRDGCVILESDGERYSIRGMLAGGEKQPAH